MNQFDTYIFVGGEMDWNHGQLLKHYIKRVMKMDNRR